MTQPKTHTVMHDGMAEAVEDLRVSNLFKTLRFHQSNKNYQRRRKGKKTFPAVLLLLLEKKGREMCD